MNSLAIATAIAALDVDGVRILDITELPDSILARDCPILMPDPEGWMLGGNAEPASRTFGTPTTRYWEFDRAYRYVYLHAAAASGRGLKDHYAGMSAKLDLIFEALAELDTDGDVMLVQVTEFGALTDPVGLSFYGCKLTLTMRERINA